MDRKHSSRKLEPFKMQIEDPLANLDIESLLVKKLGQFGRYQRLIFLLICLPVPVTAALTMDSIFTEYSPPSRCFLPGCDDDLRPRYENFSDFSDYNLTGDDECWNFPQLNSTDCLTADLSQLEAQGCERRVFSDSVMKDSVVTEFSLVCDDELLLTICKSSFFSGTLVGSLLLGHLADIVGRKMTFLISLLEIITFALLSAFSSGFIMYVTVQFFTAMGIVGMFQTSFLMVVELVGPGSRTLCGTLIQGFYIVGELYVVLVAWYFRDWRTVKLVCALPAIVFISYYYFLPESVRWLLIKKKYSKAEAGIKMIAAGNKVEMPSREEIAQYKKQEEDASDVTETFVSLLRRRRMLTRLLKLFPAWVAIQTIYFSKRGRSFDLSLNPAKMTGNFYSNTGLMFLCDVPGYTASYFGMKLLGRRLTLQVSLLLGGISSLTARLIANTNQELSLGFFLLGKFGATAAFGTTYLYTSELFPTQVRGLCFGLCDMIGALGVFSIPYIARLGERYEVDWLPEAVFAGTSLLSFLATLLLPETRNRTLPRTLDEAECI